MIETAIAVLLLIVLGGLYARKLRKDRYQERLARNIQTGGGDLSQSDPEAKSSTDPVDWTAFQDQFRVDLYKRRKEAYK